MHRKICIYDVLQKLRIMIFYSYDILMKRAPGVLM